MKHNWRIRRQTQSTPDALQRWDRAYQYLLQWTPTTRLDQPANPQPSVTSNKEVPNACSNLCPCLDRQSGPRSDD